ncbi:MAG TPA: 3-methyl-2-oxobutanoate hydroxymethyltransferase [Bryobacteraceae bacterium]|jgi:3-methyl-2-oxobutanoate hydroxymethyltransferase
MKETGTKIWAPQLKQMKQRGEKIVMLTAYDALMARLLDEAGVDVLLVGDSLGMVVLGYETTLPVTMDAMVHHTAAVTRGASRALVVADMPFLSYQTSVDDAVRNAGRLLQQGGAGAVKIEGPAFETVRRLVDTGIPVMGHLGLLPQSVNQLGGFRKQARCEDQAMQLIEDAKQLEQAGAFSIVLESIPDELGRMASEAIGIPTIGIGAGPDCDGQVLVAHDALGLTPDPVPSFVKRYAQLGDEIVKAAQAYAQDVRKGQFPQR